MKTFFLGQMSCSPMSDIASIMFRMPRQFSKVYQETLMASFSNMFRTRYGRLPVQDQLILAIRN